MTACMICSSRSVPYFTASSAEARGAAQVGGDLGAQVAPPLVRRPHVREDDLLHVAIDDPRGVEAHGRQAQALAVDLGRRAVAAGRAAADVRPVGAHAGPAEQPALEKGRRDDVDVGEMAAAEVRVVVDEDVAGRRRVGKARITAFTASGIEPR